MKYVLVTGGVVSGLGKGVTASSMGVLLQARGLRVTSIKIGGAHAKPARQHTSCRLCRDVAGVVGVCNPCYVS